ncbi:response regulator [Paenibacillus macerans]|uniref:response regulator n=1 Tax=Paenibacillus macerans TaxID=44252 RepID=UPI00203DDC5B|nr:response regulator [Paenibacillus macerans]MCM3701362.1 response regulator [Paenibacillus macerans]
MKPIKVLIVDDEPRICRGLKRLVASCGEEWEVLAALGDGREALDFLQTQDTEIDLLITDIRMPEMDGLTLIREAGKIRAFLAVVLTGYNDFEYVRTALKEGAADYLLKPIDREQLAAVLEEIRQKVEERRLQDYRWSAMRQKEAMLRFTQQTQVLGRITADGSDLARLGFWVDTFPKGEYILMYISMDTLPVKARSFTDQDWRAYSYVLENMTGEVVGEAAEKHRLSGWWWPGTRVDFWALLCRPAEAHGVGALEEAAQEVADRIREAVRTYTPFTVSVSFGEPIGDLYLLPYAKRQAISAMQHRLLDGGNKLLPYGRIHRSGGNGGGQPDGLLPSLLRRMKRAVEQADAAEAEAVCRQLFEHIGGYASPAQIRKVAENVLLLIESTLFETCGETAGGAGAEAALREAREAVNLQELKLLALRLIRRAMATLEQARSGPAAKPVEAAKEWIGRNLGNPITVKKIAGQVHMNPTYFCQYFKLQTGETVLEYVTRVRLEQARRLLADPAAKLRDVSRAVGYQDVRYFSRLFRQHFGQLPSEYRGTAGTG